MNSPIGSRTTLLTFLQELDRLLSEPAEVILAGAAALVVAYGAPRTTRDVDVIIEDRTKLRKLFRYAGRGSSLHRRHGIHLETLPDFALRPDDWRAHVKKAPVAGLRNIRLKSLYLHDLICTNLGRLTSKDLEDIRFLAKNFRVNWRTLLRRYRNARRYEINPRRTDENFLASGRGDLWSIRCAALTAIRNLTGSQDFCGQPQSPGANRQWDEAKPADVRHASFPSPLEYSCRTSGMTLICWAGTRSMRRTSSAHQY